MNIYHNKIFFLMEKNMISCLETERNTFCRIHQIQIESILYNVYNFYNWDFQNTIVSSILILTMIIMKESVVSGAAESQL